MKIPVFRGPIERIMMVGLPRNIAIISIAFVAAIVLGLQNIWILVVAVPVFIAVRFMYKKDPFFLEILLQHINEDDHLSV